MGWNEVDLKQVNPNLDPVSAEVHVFTLLGANYSPRDPNEINLKVAVAEGEFAGRIMFPSYPDPQKFDWSPKALKRLESALGVDCEDGEDKVAWLNRAANSRFRAKVKHDKYIPEGSDRETIKPKILTFTVEPAA